MANECRAQYQGDEVLARLLDKAGSRYDLDSLRALIRGVIGAAPSRDPAAWCQLVASDPSPALVAQLLALKAEIEAQDAARPHADAAARLAAVREGMVELEIDAFLVPRADEYQNEYVPAGNSRLAWLTGFSGSAGMAVLLADQAAIFVDGRYTIQVVAETDAALYTPHHLIEDPPDVWVGTVLKPGQVLGYDAWLLTPAQVERFAKGAAKAGAVLKPVAWNPLDKAWAASRPAQPLGPVVPHPIEFSGKSSADKRAEIASVLERDKIDATVVTAADSLAWLLNIRGADVPHTPLALGFALVRQDGQVDLFIDRRKLTPGIEAHLGNGVAVRAPDELAGALDDLKGQTVQVDPASAAAWIFERLAAAGATIVRAADPIALPKALKNETELAGARAAHRRDGVAMTRFLHWLDATAPTRTLTEIEISDRLEAFRAENERFRDLSFDSISGAGPNGAIMHYHALPTTNRELDRDSLYLIDSGAQYLDGTTDITRTIAIGTPSSEMKDRYTRVLKGHIALSMAVFPKGTTGTQLDILARAALWQIGVTFDHGTGHGVGSYLGVHEGPQRIATAPNSQALLPGMVLSNEPGYYKPGAYGIRIENLIAVTPVNIEGAEREMLGFETLTFCPIDKRPIEPSLMTEAEISWLDSYHAQVRQIIGPLLSDTADRLWLDAATAPLIA